jgi:hypothetical protein
MAALSLGACGARHSFTHAPEVVSAGAWKIEREPDPITGVAVASAFVTSRNSSNANELMPRLAMLQLSCFRDEPMIAFKFRFKIGTNVNSFLGYRFDDKPGHDVEARFLQQHDSVVIEERTEVIRFVQELATASVLRIRIRSMNAGRTTAEFDVTGAPEAIKAGFATCPLTPLRDLPPLRGRTS